MSNQQKTRNNFIKHDIPLRFVKVLNVILMTMPFALCWFGYYAARVSSPFYKVGNYYMIGLYMLLYFIFARVYDAFLVSINRISEMIYSQMLAALVADGLTYLIIVLLMKRLPNILPGIAALIFQLGMAIVWSTCAHWWYFSVFSPKKSMIIYDNREGMEQLINEYGLDKKFDVGKIMPVNYCLDHIDLLKDADSIFLSGIHSKDRNVILKYCVENHITVYVIPRIGDVIMSGATRMHMFHLPLLRVGRYNPTPEYLALKRLFDFIASAIALIIVSPIMAVTAVAIKIYDRGPIFYKQNRLTKDGKQFNVLKFRSMSVNAEANGVARLSSGDNDPRITPVGRIIRKYRIDELPQFFNVLAGSMSIVGPRPERPEIAEQYEEVIPEFRLRLQAKAGLTGLAQVYGKYNTSPYDKLQMDLMYIAHPSILDDLRICFATVKILFLPESTEGVAEGQVTAMENVK